MSQEEVHPMSEDQSTPQTPGSVVEMPWVLISNQIQLLSTQINERFNDQRLRFEDRFTHIDQHIEEVETRLNQRIDQVDKRIDQVETHLGQRIDQVDKRIDQIDKRIDGIESRLTFRNSTWLTIILGLLTLIIGALLAPHL